MAYKDTYDNGNGRSGSEADKANEILGGLITLPSNTAAVVNLVKSTFKPWAIEKGEGAIHAKMPGVLESLGMSQGTAGNLTSRTATSLAWLVIFSEELAGAYRNLSNYAGANKQLAEDVQPVLKAQGKAAGLIGSQFSNNEVLAHARKCIRQKLVRDTAFDMTDLAASLPTLYVRYKNNEARLAGAADPKPDSPKSRSQLFNEQVTEFVEQYGYEKQDAIKAVQSMGQLNAQDERLRKEEIKDTKEAIEKYAVPIGAVITEMLRGHMEGKHKRNKEAEPALMMIRRLADTVIDDHEATSVKGVPFEQYIKDIFQTHQRNMGQPEIGKRYEEKLDFACKEIANAITEGKMHPMALVNLVGERKIIKDKGKHVATREDIHKAIADQIERMPAKFSVDADEYFAETSIGEQDLKSILSGLKGEERTFFISLLPEEVALRVGVKEQEIKAAHEHAKAHFTETLNKAVLDVGSLSDEELEKAGLSKDEIELIRDVAPKAKQGDTKSVLAAVSTKGDYKDKLDFALVNAARVEFANGRKLGELYEHAGQKLFAEHEHPEGRYDDEAPDMQEDKPHNQVHHAHHKGREHEVHAQELGG